MEFVIKDQERSSLEIQEEIIRNSITVEVADDSTRKLQDSICTGNRDSCIKQTSIEEDIIDEKIDLLAETTIHVEMSVAGTDQNAKFEQSISIADEMNGGAE